MAPRPRTLTVAILSLLLSGFAITSSAAAAPAADNECAGMTAQSHVVAGNTAPVANADSAPVLAGDFTVFDVLGNDTDAEGDPLSVITLTEPAHGFACINGDGTIEYFSDTGTPTGTDQFTYGITDGDYFRTATVTMSIEGLDNVVPTLTRRLKLDRPRTRDQARQGQHREHQRPDRGVLRRQVLQQPPLLRQGHPRRRDRDASHQAPTPGLRGRGP